MVKLSSYLYELSILSVASILSMCIVCVLVLLCLVQGVSAQVRFVDIASGSGIDFVHYTGASGRKYLPETMGAGLAFFDYDSDGDLDLYFPNGAPLPGSPRTSTPVNALYRNDGSNSGSQRFTFTGAAADTGYGMGCCLGDYDSDGDLDLYLTNFGINRLYRNDEGRFTDVTGRAGVGDASWSTGCAFVDTDQDGLLDIYVVNYLGRGIAGAPRCVKDGRPYYCHPSRYPAQADILFANQGRGRFADITRASGVYEDVDGKGLGIAVFDYDQDGDLDLYIANDTTRNFLYRNDGGLFAEIGEFAGAAYNGDALPEAGMGVAVSDVEGDGDFDIFVTNFELETNTLYQYEGRDFFADGTFAADLGGPGLAHLGFGALFLDYDNDGDEDLFVANGHIQTDMRLHDGTIGADQPDQIFANDGNGRFYDISSLAGAYFRLPMISRGVASGDFDQDGDLDLAVTHCGQAPSLLRNDGGNNRNWLQLYADPAGFIDAGVRLRLRAGSITQHKQIVAGASYLSQSEQAAFFGLGEATRVDTLEIVWPGKGKLLLRDIPVNRRLHLDLDAADELFSD